MAGFIRRQEIIENSELVIELYGLDVFNACLVADKNETFLGLLVKMGRL
jgi:hypothetical protein